MTPRRKWLLLLLLIILTLPLLGFGLIGSVELTIWLGLMALWCWVFFTWGKRRAAPSQI